MIFLLNPCHVLTVSNILVLGAYINGWATSPLVRGAHTLNAHFIHGPVIALLLPVTNTLLLPFEVCT